MNLGQIAFLGGLVGFAFVGVKAPLELREAEKHLEQSFSQLRLERTRGDVLSSTVAVLKDALAECRRRHAACSKTSEECFAELEGVDHRLEGSLRRLELLETREAELRSIVDQVEGRIPDVSARLEGLRVVMTLPEPILYDPGEFIPDFRRLDDIEEIGRILAPGLIDGRIFVVVEGHTDSSRFGPPPDWVLSATLTPSKFQTRFRLSGADLQRFQALVPAISREYGNRILGLNRALFVLYSFREGVLAARPGISREMIASVDTRIVPASAAATVPIDLERKAGNRRVEIVVFPVVADILHKSSLPGRP